MSIEVFARTDPGPVRENNEDSFLVEASTGLFAVADGMGGHAAGEVASQIAVETIKEIIWSLTTQMKHGWLVPFLMAKSCCGSVYATP